jgi:hypothetical protein
MKQLFFFFTLLITVFFSYTVIAQELGSLRKGYEIAFPEKIQQPLGPPLAPGTYTIGTGGYFPTIDSAFKKLSVDGIAGEIVLELIDELYIAPTTQYGFLLNGPIPGVGPNSRVIIKPAANKNVIIEGNSYAVLYFMNTSYLTLDGVGLTGATTLTIHVIKNTQFLWNDAVDFMNNSDHNVIQNTIFINEDYSRSSTGPAFYPEFFAGSLFAPDSNLIQNNFIKKAGFAIYVSAENSPVKAIGNIIRGNIVGTETDSLIGWGIQAQFTQNTIVENNIVQNVRRQGNPDIDIIHGINSYYGNGVVIRNNIVHNIHSNGVKGATGILLSGGVGNVGNNNSVYNNMVYDIQSTSTLGTSRVAGIQMWNQNDPKIYYNSVYLSGNGYNPLGSAALYIDAQCTNVDAKNNILVNTRNESPYCAAAIYDYSTSNLTTDFNDLYYETSTNNCLVRIGSTKYNTLPEWRAMGKDLNSVTEMPNFISPYLHISETIPTSLEKGATPIAGITIDFDEQLRNTTMPDIGADEFDGVVGVEKETTLPTEFALAQNYPNPFNSNCAIKYSIPKSSQVTLKIFNTLGEEIEILVNEEKPVGTYEVNWNAANLPSGVYFYRLQVVDPETSSGQGFVHTRKMILLK